MESTRRWRLALVAAGLAARELSSEGARLAALRALRVDAFDHLAQLRLGGFIQRQEGVPGGAIGWDRFRGKPL